MVVGIAQHQQHITTETELALGAVMVILIMKRTTQQVGIGKTIHITLVKHVLIKQHTHMVLMAVGIAQHQQQLTTKTELALGAVMLILLVEHTQAHGIMEMMQNTIKIAVHVEKRNIHQEHVQEAHGQIIKRQVFMERNVEHVVEFIQLVHMALGELIIHQTMMEHMIGKHLVDIVDMLRIQARILVTM